MKSPQPMSYNQAKTVKTPNKAKQANTSKKLGSLIKYGVFLAVFSGIMVFAAYSFISHNPKPIAQKFFENRKMGQDYQDYKDNESAKKKAERNVFLQD